MSKKKDTIKFLEAQNSLLRAENDRLKNSLEIKERHISCLNKIAILGSEVTGEKNAKESLRMLTECCCEFGVEL